MTLLLYIWPAIMPLLKMRSPTAVGRFVVTIWVDSIQRPFLWAMTHVGKEVLKRGLPSVADLDAATTVVIKLSSIWVVAPFFHCHPRLVGSGFMHSVRGSCPTHSGNRLPMQAPTGFGSIGSAKVPRLDYFGRPTDTDAVPPDSFANIGCAVDDSKATKSLSGQIVN